MDVAAYLAAMNSRKYYAAAISAFTIWGFLPMALKSLAGFPSGSILYFRICFSCVVLVLVLGLFRRKPLQRDVQLLRQMDSVARRNSILMMLAGGFLLTVNWLVFIYTVNEVNIRTASFSYLICPVITAALGFVILKERMSTTQWVALGLCALSCVIMGINSVTELGYSITTAFTYALYLVLQRRSGTLDRMTVLGVQILFSFFLMNMFYGYLIDTVPTDTRFYYTTFIIGAVFTILPLFLNLYALIGINSATVGVLMYLNPIINFTIAFLLFDEQVTPLQITGYTIIAAALVLFNFQNFKKLKVAMS